MVTVGAHPTAGFVNPTMGFCQSPMHMSIYVPIIILLIIRTYMDICYIINIYIYILSLYSIRIHSRHDQRRLEDWRGSTQEMWAAGGSLQEIQEIHKISRHSPTQNSIRFWMDHHKIQKLDRLSAAKPWRYALNPHP